MNAILQADATNTNQALPFSSLIEQRDDAVLFGGVSVEKSQGGALVPEAERFSRCVLTDYDLALLQKLAIVLSLNQPVLIEGGTGIGKSTLTDLICAYTNWESYYVNCREFEVEQVIGGKTVREDTKSGFGFKDGVAVAAIRNGGVLFLDEYNFMRGTTRGRLHELLDAAIAGKKKIVLVENDGEVVNVHPRFRIVAAQNAPGNDFLDREVLDPGQLTRFVYLKEPEQLPREVLLARMYGALRLPHAFTMPGIDAFTPGPGIPREELYGLRGMDKLIDRYYEFTAGIQKMLDFRKLAADEPQRVYMNAQRDFNRVLSFIEAFYSGNLSATMQAALRFYFKNRFAWVPQPEAPPGGNAAAAPLKHDREQVEELLRVVVYDGESPKSSRRSIVIDNPAEDAMGATALQQFREAEQLLNKLTERGLSEFEMAKVRALGAAARSGLIERLGHEKPEARERVARALLQMGEPDEEVLRVITDLLSDKDPELRVSACLMLENIGEKAVAVVGKLAEALSSDDNNDDVREAICGALDRITDGEPELRNRVATAIHLDERIPEDARALACSYLDFEGESLDSDAEADVENFILEDEEGVDPNHENGNGQNGNGNGHKSKRDGEERKGIVGRLLSLVK